MLKVISRHKGGGNIVITDVKRIKSASSGALSNSNSGLKSPLTHNCRVFFCFLFFASSQMLAALCIPRLILFTTYLSLRYYLQKWCDFSLGARCRAHSVAAAKKTWWLRGARVEQLPHRPARAASGLAPEVN